LPAHVRDVVAFILKSNTPPSGANDLPDTIAALKQIKMEEPARRQKVEGRR
jgi:hypothetical protein